VGKAWKPYEQALSEVEARLAEMLPDETRRLVNLEDLANRQLQNWLADGLIDATAWQLQWNRGHGAFGAGSLGLHFPDSEADQATSGNQADNGKPIAIPGYWWRMWLSSDDANRDLFHYPHYRGSTRRPDGSGIEWIGSRFIATGAKLSASGIGECWRVVHLDPAQLAKALSGLTLNVAVAAGKVRARDRGAPPKADYGALFTEAAAFLQTQGVDHREIPAVAFVLDVMALRTFKEIASPPKERTLEGAVYQWRRQLKPGPAQ
jgi:hypothetical protein